MAYVYKHTRNDTNVVFYIGIGKYQKRAFSKSGRNKHWTNIVNKFGDSVEIIELNLTWEEACEFERYWIKFYGRRDLNEGTLVNMTDGGDGQIGRIASDEFKLKLKQSNTGKTLSDNHKDKISEACKGKVLSDEHKLNLSKSLLGRPHSDIHKLNISKSMKGKMTGDKNPRYGKKLSEETKEKLRIAALKNAEKNKKVL
jgi:hypothetical protein